MTQVVCVPKKYAKRMKKRKQLILSVEELDAELIKKLAEMEGISVSEKLRTILEPFLEQLRLSPELRERMMYPLRLRRAEVPELKSAEVAELKAR